MTNMRVTATVVGNTLVVDDETAAELAQALKEADAGDFVSEEEVWASIEARYGK